MIGRSAGAAAFLYLTVAVAASPVRAASGQSPTERCGLHIPSSEERAFVGLPTSDVFCPIIADPKGLRSFVSYLRETSRGDSLTRLGSVGIGDMFGIARWGGDRNGNGVQLSISGSVFAQFDLDTESFDLINADYVIGVPLTFRRGRFSGRLRLYHQSSHLGDEYVLREDDPERVNLSFEATEVILSLDVGSLRIFGGGEYLFNREPKSLERHVAHGGAELRPGPPLVRLPLLGSVRFLAGADLKASEEQEWEPSISVRAGLEFDRARSSDPPARRWSLLIESYSGPSPYGQFFRQKIQYLGAGLHFQL
ncbi:MAG: DUF1207 domain-containing protein [Gemmatimonadota bacterium]